MFRVIGIVVSLYVISYLVSIIDANFSTTIIGSLICDDYVAIIASLVGLNMASIAFLVGNMNNISLTIKDKSNLFGGVRRELKENIIFMICVILPLAIIGNGIISCPLAESSSLYVASGLFTIFLLAVYCIYETTIMIFKIKL